MRWSKFFFALEIIGITAVFYLDYINVHVDESESINLFFSKTPYLFILGWISLRVRRLGWRDVGLNGTQPFLKILVIGVVAGVAMEALELFVTQPILTKLLHKGPDLEEFRRMIGSTKLLIVGVVLSWVLAAFGEETVWRGYVLNRCADLFGRSRIGWIISAVLVSLVFGFAHFPQGPTGVIENIIAGAILAALYFATGRNLWAPIIAHGIQDTVDVLLIYLGIYPGLSESGVALLQH